MTYIHASTPKGNLSREATFSAAIDGSKPVVPLYKELDQLRQKRNLQARVWVGEFKQQSQESERSTRPLVVVQGRAALPSGDLLTLLPLEVSELGNRPRLLGIDDFKQGCGSKTLKH